MNSARIFQGLFLALLFLGLAIFVSVSGSVFTSVLGSDFVSGTGVEEIFGSAGVDETDSGFASVVAGMMGDATCAGGVLDAGGNSSFGG